MCLLSGVWRLSMELLVSQKCTYTLCSMHIKTWTYKLQVWFDPWFNESVLMSCAMPSLHRIAKPQLGKVIIERKYVSLYSMGFYLKLHGHLTIELETWICSCFKFSHKTLLFGFLLVIITSLSLFLSLSHTHIHANNLLYSDFLLTTFASKYSILLYIYFLMSSWTV